MDNEYIVLVKEEYVRDIQMASNDLIEDSITNPDEVEPDGYGWLDLEGDVSLGTWHAQSNESARYICSQHLEIHMQALIAYRIVKGE